MVMDMMNVCTCVSDYNVDAVCDDAKVLQERKRFELIHVDT